MKTTIVPAQITTVEDRIAGNLTFTQLLLLTTPVFVTGAVFAFLPPFMSLSAYKLLFCGTLFVICLILATRVKGRLVMEWASVLSRYNIRPRFYVFDKNSMYLRQTEQVEELPQESSDSDRREVSELIPVFEMPINQRATLEHTVSDPRANFHISRSRKGGLRVHIHEIK